MRLWQWRDLLDGLNLLDRLRYWLLYLLLYLLGDLLAHLLLYVSHGVLRRWYMSLRSRPLARGGDGRCRMGLTGGMSWSAVRDAVDAGHGRRRG